MAKRPCPKDGCPTLINTGERYCAPHQREADRARGTTTERGYGSTHKALRAHWQTLITREPQPCTRCGQPITTHDTWHLDHDDHDRSKYRGPSHATCNTAAGGRLAHSN